MKQILLIDKDAAFTNTVSAILSNEDFQVSVAKDGKEAAGALADHSYDLVITNVLMPFSNGFELVSGIRLKETSRHTPVMMISDITNEHNIEHCIRAGADAFIKKPLDIPQFLSGIKNLVRSENNVAA
jgi:DNA-binding response OmpR family regulator